ncbi:HAD-IC family P-type ATPase, partial [Bacillus velezensis]|uniref:HAD-IC family P-type ATPase n=1 Tax=Bacillus velezensis TaxID=492670 RepID=UPI0039F6E42B
QIVKLLQEDGHLVGMTGDGVNDAPALKQAELGTAVSSASDVAKASASIIFTHPGLHDIIAAITTSRQTYQRMLTWVINKITKVIEIIILFTLGFFWLKVSLVSLLGMSLLVFANDFATMSIATDNV